MRKVTKTQRIRVLRILGAVVLAVALFWLATDYSSKDKPSLLRTVPLPKPPKKLEEVLGAVERLAPGQKNEEETETPKPEILSLSKIKEDTQEKVIESSKEVVREKVVEILKELIDKLTEEEKTKEKVCDQVCEEVCKDACE